MAANQQLQERLAAVEANLTAVASKGYGKGGGKFGGKAKGKGSYKGVWNYNPTGSGFQGICWHCG